MGYSITWIIQSLYYSPIGRCINAWMHSLKKFAKPEIVNRYDLCVLRHKIGGAIVFVNKWCNVVCNTHIRINTTKHEKRWNMETKPRQIPYPMENWKMRYMVVWIQNHDKLIVLIWKTLDMRFGGKIRINLLHCVTWFIL
jgi:hypothetical protein